MSQIGMLSSTTAVKGKLCKVNNISRSLRNCTSDVLNSHDNLSCLVTKLYHIHVELSTQESVYNSQITYSTDTKLADSPTVNEAVMIQEAHSCKTLATNLSTTF